MTIGYAHLAPAAFEPDYGRIVFHIPDEPAKLVELVRGDGGRVPGHARLARDSATTSGPALGKIGR